MANSTSDIKYNAQTGKFVTGRTSKYYPGLAEELIQHCSEGKSLNAFCAIKKIARQTLDNWAKEHEEFKFAHEIAKYGFAAFYEESLRKQIIGEAKGDSRANIFALKAYCGYRDAEAAQTNIQVNYDSLPEEQKLRVLQEALKQIEAKELVE